MRTKLKLESESQPCNARQTEPISHWSCEREGPSSAAMEALSRERHGLRLMGTCSATDAWKICRCVAVDLHSPAKESEGSLWPNTVVEKSGQPKEERHGARMAVAIPGRSSPRQRADQRWRCLIPMLFGYLFSVEVGSWRPAR